MSLPTLEAFEATKATINICSSEDKMEKLSSLLIVNVNAGKYSVLSTSIPFSEL